MELGDITEISSYMINVVYRTLSYNNQMRLGEVFP